MSEKIQNMNVSIDEIIEYISIITENESDNKMANFLAGKAGQLARHAESTSQLKDVIRKIYLFNRR